MDVTDYPADKLVEIYVKLRDKRAALKAKFEEEDSSLSEQMDILSKEMLEICKENGADSIKTSAGTIMRSVATRYWTNDWDSFYNFVRENDAIGVFEKRIHQGNMKQFLEEHPDTFPPGMLVDSQYKIIVRRSK